MALQIGFYYVLCGLEFDTAIWTLVWFCDLDYVMVLRFGLWYSIPLIPLCFFGKLSVLPDLLTYPVAWSLWCKRRYHFRLWGLQSRSEEKVLGGQGI